MLFPIGVRKVGRIAATKEAIVINRIEEQSEWVKRYEWVQEEKIVSFAGQPLLYRDEALGTLVVFSRNLISDDGLDWIRMLADHAAAALANAKAFRENEQLRDLLELENNYLREEVSEASAFGDIIGQSEALKKMVNQINLVAETDTNVMIYGESGTGKELVAREIHKRSNRSRKPLIKVNCASIPKELFESEFFGHVKGSFTGAIKDRLGRFHAADGGTLFLDEIGEIPIELQSKLLRVLQEGEFERVGEERTRRVDVRIIGATNRDLKLEVEEKRFRQDLFYRLNVFPVEVAPLRDRVEDIPLLVESFLREMIKKNKRSCQGFSPAQMIQMQQYHWPGNIRELQNVVERAVITCQTGAITLDLPFHDHPTETDSSSAPASEEQDRVLTNLELKKIEKKNIITALQQTGWKIYGTGGAADLIGLKPTTLVSKIKKYNIKK
jgi:transcriptional regulator with GAF, ATPase, and Fis domain